MPRSGQRLRWKTGRFAPSLDLASKAASTFAARPPSLKSGASRRNDGMRLFSSRQPHTRQKEPRMNRHVALVSVLVSGLLVSGLLTAAQAEPFPSGPIRIVVPTPPGTPPDII